MSIFHYQEATLDAGEFIDLLQRSGLAARRPVDDARRIEAMLDGADLIVTARDEARDRKLVGVSRCITDFAYCCYCSDLAVDRDYQRQGIGSKLIEASRMFAGHGCSFFLISAPQAVRYYERIGMPRIEGAFGWLESPGE